MTFEPLYGIPPLIFTLSPALILFLLLLVGGFVLFAPREVKQEMLGMFRRRPAEAVASAGNEGSGMPRAESGFTVWEILAVAASIIPMTFGCLVVMPSLQFGHLQEQLNTQAAEKYGIVFLDEEKSLKGLLGERYSKALKDDGTEVDVLRGFGGEISLIEGLEEGVGYTLPGIVLATDANGGQFTVSLRWDGKQWILVETATPVEPTERFIPIETQP